MKIDTTFDVRLDSFGQDPDFASETLRYYHRLLWSKELPNGQILVLDENLNNISNAGKLELSSDSIIHTYSKWKRTELIIKQISQEKIENFLTVAYRIGGFIVFPRNTINGKYTLNRERGFNHYINDRIDLTLECIRRFYIGQRSPLTECINRYSDFFNLFLDFNGYVEFFLLQDLVNEDCTKINFLYPFDEFTYNPLPQNVAEYLDYMKRNIDFVENRNQRINSWQNKYLNNF